MKCRENVAADTAYIGVGAGPLLPDFLEVVSNKKYDKLGCCMEFRDFLGKFIKI